MKKIVIAILFVATLGVLFIFFQNRSAKQQTPTADLLNQPTGATQNWESKIDTQSAVTITITPIDISPQSKEWKFNIVMDSHSVELDQDLIKTVVLADDQGKEYVPINWKGPVGSHHREGMLTFSQVTPAPKYIELKIKNVGGSAERLFSWNLDTNK